MFKMLNEKMKKMTVIDISLVKFSSLLFGIILAKLFPGLLSLGYPLLIVLILACGAKPLYKFWLQK
ncbi:MAG: hypothetical protein PHT50_06550 [Candidatus Omnitrophica bacterium]|nr:hypothetical protein [Candidatus Omnitrophota bacterium]